MTEGTAAEGEASAAADVAASLRENGECFVASQDFQDNFDALGQKPGEEELPAEEEASEEETPASLSGTDPVVPAPGPQERPEDEIVSGEDIYNPSALDDETLYRIALDMRQTQPGDTLAYVQKWIQFQERFAESLPMIPLYSNVYFDFYSRTLHDYVITGSVTWGQAIVSSYLSDPEDLEDENALEEDLEFEEDEDLVEIDD